MRAKMTGRQDTVLAVLKGSLLSLSLLAGVGLSACTTAEGTNALTDFGTFEREVMTSTLVGVGMIDKPSPKDDPTGNRAPLVLPKAGAPLPTPSDARTEVAALPADSSRVEIDTTGLSEEDLRRLRNARVVDLRALSGRPLTEAEAKQLTARMTAAQLKPGERPIYLPPDEYFTQIKGQDLVCLAKNGDLVPVDSPDCPPEIKKALQAQAKPQ